MTRDDLARLDDIEAAVAAIRFYVSRGSLDDDVVFDAVRVRLIEIGEAVKGISTTLRDSEPGLPWSRIAGMRDHLTHRYFMTDRGVVRSTVEDDLIELADAVVRMREQSES